MTKSRRGQRVTLTVVGVDEGDPTGEARPIVKIVAGERTEALDKIGRLLVERDPDIFQRGDCLVWVAPEDIALVGGEKVSALRIVGIGKERLRELITKAVRIQMFDKRAEEWTTRDTPKDLAAAYLERVGMWGHPPLHAVVTAPTLRPDGSIIDKPGYDRATGVYFDPRDVEFPSVPRSPTRALAREALDYLEGLLGTFDFVDEASRSVALSGLITPLVRPALETAPLHAITATVAGSGKSKLADMAAILATGHRAPVMALGQRDEEAEKGLKASLLAGDVVVCIDNVERPLGGDLLSQAVTQQLLSVRQFNTLTNFRIANQVCVFSTGNNLVLLGDLTRRSLVCALDPRCERPELREFETPDPCGIALRDRPTLVAAALSIVRAFFLEGCPRSTAAIGSFEGWSKWVRDPLIWLGRADPAATMEKARGSDPRLSVLSTILAQWSVHLGDRRVTAQEVIAMAGQQGVSGYSYPEFREALLGVGGERGTINSRRFGKWLAAVAGRRVTVDLGDTRSRRMLCRASAKFGVTSWQVVSC